MYKSWIWIYRYLSNEDQASLVFVTINIEYEIL